MRKMMEEFDEQVKVTKMFSILIKEQLQRFGIVCKGRGVVGDHTFPDQLNVFYSDKPICVIRVYYDQVLVSHLSYDFKPEFLDSEIFEYQNPAFPANLNDKVIKMLPDTSILRKIHEAGKLQTEPCDDE